MSQSIAAGVVLAGGKSSRMGRDKALIEFHGKPLIAHAVALLQLAGLPVSISGTREDLARFAPVVPDSESDRGPLHGICCGLAASNADMVVFTSIDLPLLPVELIRRLLAMAQTTGNLITLVSVNGFAQTFPAVIHRHALPFLERELGEGAGGCFVAYQRAARASNQYVLAPHLENLVQAGQVAHPAGTPPSRWFLNINSPCDLDFAERCLP